MPIDFPSGPVDGQTVTLGNNIYTYNAARGTWDLTVGLAPVAETFHPFLLT